MKTTLDCIPCVVRQSLEAVRIASASPVVQEQVLRTVLQWAAVMDMNDSPPVLAQRVHRYIRKLAGVADPYRAAKDRWNQAALQLLPDLRTLVNGAADPLALAARLAVAGNVIDFGVNGHLTESDLRVAIQHALDEPFVGDWSAFRQAMVRASRILYLADNAGEIVFDRLLLEQLWPARVTVAVRGTPVLNDATRADAQAVGLTEAFAVIDNGSDAPGTILEECSTEFRQHFDEADLILAKGQGNNETLNECPRNIFFLFKAKCPVVAAQVGVAVGTQVLARSSRTEPEACA